MYLTKEVKAKIFKKHGGTAENTGSTESHQPSYRSFKKQS